MNVYTSDIHFFDDFIHRVCSRPFSSVEEMNSIIFSRWNKKICSFDTVYILGDIFAVCGGNVTDALEMLKRLNGRKILILGNHDDPFINEINTSGIFDDIYSLLRIDDDGVQIILCHYPLMTWQNDDKDSFHFYGHIHNKNLPQIKNYFIDKKAYNVGMDVRAFEPNHLMK